MTNFVHSYLKGLYLSEHCRNSLFYAISRAVTGTHLQMCVKTLSFATGTFSLIVSMFIALKVLKANLSHNFSLCVACSSDKTQVPTYKTSRDSGGWSLTHPEPNSNNHFLIRAGIIIFTLKILLKRTK